MGRVDWFTVFRIAGAYVAYVIGSGFATGQEIVHFFTVYGIESTSGILVSAVLFALVGAFIISDGVKRGGGSTREIYSDYCGVFLGYAFNLFVPVLLFGSVVIMLAGSGATAEEYYGIDYNTGALLMALAVFFSYIGGFNRIVSIMGFFGPAVIIFSIIVGLLTFYESGGLAGIKDCESVYFGIVPPADNVWSSGILYVSYNVSTAAVFFRALGSSAKSKSEAVIGSVIGAVLLMGAALAINLALLSQGDAVTDLSIPTLYLAKTISPILATAFSVVLLIEIFSTAAPMMWSVCSRIAPEGSIKAMITGAVFISLALFCSLTPFEELVGVIYPYEGRIGLIFLICLAWTKVKECGGMLNSDFFKGLWYNKTNRQIRSTGR